MSQYCTPKTVEKQTNGTLDTDLLLVKTRFIYNGKDNNKWINLFHVLKKHKDIDLISYHCKTSFLSKITVSVGGWPFGR